MKHAELLNDPTSLERGNELLAIMADANKREQELRQADTLALEHVKQTCDELEIKSRTLAGELEQGNTFMSEADYAEFGREWLDAVRAEIQLDSGSASNQLDHGRTAYEPIEDVLNAYNNKPIAVKFNKQGFITGLDKPVWKHPYPRKIGGFIIPRLGFSAPNLYIGLKQDDLYQNGYKIWMPRVVNGESSIRIAIGE